MKKLYLAGAFLLAATVVSVATFNTQASEKKDMMFAHMVYFGLKEPSQKAKDELVQGCHKYLSDIDGTVFYAAGLLAEDADRDVNVRDFDVALQLVFDSKEAHDKYQVHPQHEEFVAKFRDKMKSIRVFDAYVSKK